MGSNGADTAYAPVQARYVAAPWGAPQQIGSDRLAGGRPCLVTSAEVDQVKARYGDALPLVSEVTHDSGHRVRLWELPGTMAEADELDGPVSEQLELYGASGSSGTSLSLNLSGLPRPSLTEQADDDDVDAHKPVAPWSRAGSIASQMVGQHVYVMHEALGSSPPDDALTWPAGPGRLVTRDRDRLIDQWIKAGETREPRYALIVRLAESFDQKLTAVCQQPRVILKRVRQMQGVGRVQQVDPACLRWLGRAPGRTIPEKAGSKQQVMAVTRVEHANTLENRVVKDLLRRAIRAARAYLDEHRTFGNHTRVQKVRRFLRKLQHLQRQSAIAGIRPIDHVPQPNYVLQHDRRYGELWRVYLQLIRQERELDNAWRWRHRIWSESITLAVLSALHRLEPQGPAFRADIRLHAEQVTGRFIDPSEYLAPHRIGSYWVDPVFGGQQMHEHPSVSAGLIGLGPDFVLVARQVDRDQPEIVIPIWGLLSFGLAGNMAELIACLSKRASRNSTIHPLVLIPESERSEQWQNRPHCLELSPIHPQSGVQVIEQWLAACFGVESLANCA